LKGGQVPIEKAKSPIYQYDYSAPRFYSPPGRPDLKFKIPKEIVLSPRNVHHENKSSEIMSDYEHVAKYEVSRHSFSISLNLIKFAIGFQYAREMGKIQEYLRSKFAATTRAVYYTRFYFFYFFKF
jgi:hypothetical protein